MGRHRPPAVKGIARGHTGCPRQKADPTPDSRSSALCPARSARPSQAVGSRGPGIESQSEVSKKKKKKEKKRSSRRSSQGWRPAQPVPGLGEGGNDAAWARGGLRSTIRRESACRGRQHREAPGRTAAPDARAGGLRGAGCLGHSVCPGSLRPSARQDPTHIRTHSCPRPGRGSAWVGSRTALSREEVSLERGDL